MIENIQMATKNEIREEMSNLEAKFNTKKNELDEKTKEWGNFVKETHDEMKKMSERYNMLKNEINKREGNPEK